MIRGFSGFPKLGLDLVFISAFRSWDSIAVFHCVIQDLGFGISGISRISWDFKDLTEFGSGIWNLLWKFRIWDWNFGFIYTHFQLLAISSFAVAHVASQSLPQWLKISFLPHFSWGHSSFGMHFPFSLTKPGSHSHLATQAMLQIRSSLESHVSSQSDPHSFHVSLAGQALGHSSFFMQIWVRSSKTIPFQGHHKKFAFTLSLCSFMKFRTPHLRSHGFTMNPVVIHNALIIKLYEWNVTYK